MKITEIDYSVLGVILALAVNITILLIEFAIGNISGRDANLLITTLMFLYTCLIIIVIFINNFK